MSKIKRRRLLIWFLTTHLLKSANSLTPNPNLLEAKTLEVDLSCLCFNKAPRIHRYTCKYKNVISMKSHISQSALQMYLLQLEALNLFWRNSSLNNYWLLSSEIGPHIYFSLIFQQRCQGNSIEKGQAINKCCLNNWMVIRKTKQ